MKNKKGFTLVELIGIILLLGLVVMIIVPSITNTVESAKKNTAVDSVISYIKATRDYYETNVTSKDLKIVDGDNYIEDIDSEIDVKGARPSSGFIRFENGKVSYSEMCMGEYYIIYETGSEGIQTSAIKSKSCSISK